MSKSPLITFEFWIKAFIPQEVSLKNGEIYTVPVPNGNGATMVPHPARMETYSPQDPDTKQDWQRSVVNDYGYSTDNRGFSNDKKAKARMTTYAIVSVFERDYNESCINKIGIGCFQKKYFTFDGYSKCDDTIEYDFPTGKENWRKPGDNSRMFITPAVTTIRTGGFLRIEFSINCEASLPNSSAARLFGNINYSGGIIFDEKRREITANLAYDDFPAFEAYGAINGNAGKALLQKLPILGSTVSDLGGASGTAWRMSGRGVKSSVKDEDAINPDEVIWIDTTILPSPQKKTRNKLIRTKKRKRKYRSSLRDSNNSGDLDNSVHASAVNNRDYLPYSSLRFSKTDSENLARPLAVSASA